MKPIFRRIAAAAFAAFTLAAAVVPAAAAESYLMNEDFEKQKVGKAPASIGGVSSVPLDAALNIVDLNGNKVLEFKRTAANGNTAAYVDVMTGSKSFEPHHVLSYDIMIPKQLSTAGSWQLATSRQTPPAGIQFQSTGSVDLTNGNIISDGKTLAAIPFGEWHNLTAVFDEENFRYDLYYDGRLLADGVGYSINTAAHYPERLRLGQAASAGECVVYVDNIRVYNGSVPYNLLEADIEVLSQGESVQKTYDFDLPVWTKEYDVNKIVVTSVGSVSIVLVAAIAVFVLKKGRRAE